MAQNRSGSGSLLLAGLAAFAYYKYSKMTADERRNMFDAIKAKGQKLVDKYVPADLVDQFKKKAASVKDRFEEGSYYKG